ncbi:MAG: tlde1 domain-containing protein [Pseudomonadota bacterium]
MRLTKRSMMKLFCEQVKRGQFRLHPKGRRGISQGCITLDNWTDYQVVHSLLKGTKT